MERLCYGLFTCLNVLFSYYYFHNSSIMQTLKDTTLNFFQVYINVCIYDINTDINMILNSAGNRFDRERPCNVLNGFKINKTAN